MVGFGAVGGDEVEVVDDEPDALEEHVDRVPLRRQVRHHLRPSCQLEQGSDGRVERTGGFGLASAGDRAGGFGDAVDGHAFGLARLDGVGAPDVQLDRFVADDLGRRFKDGDGQVVRLDLGRRGRLRSGRWRGRGLGVRGEEQEQRGFGVGEELVVELEHGPGRGRPDGVPAHEVERGEDLLDCRPRSSATDDEVSREKGDKHWS